MKGRARLLAVALLVASCGFDERSGEFACDGDGRCPDGRECVDGWCVIPGGGDGTTTDAAAPGPDAVPQPDAQFCPPACTECSGDVCLIRCPGNNACAATVTCPDGMECQVQCSGIDSCGGGVECGGATSCSVSCAKRQACGGAIMCGTGRCDVSCSAADTCAGGIECNDACACTTSCTGADSCALAPDCPGDGAICESGGECTDDGDATCNECP